MAFIGRGGGMASDRGKAGGKAGGKAAQGQHSR